MKKDYSLQPPKIHIKPLIRRFADNFRKWQGIPSIEVSPQGKIFVIFYSGQEAEVGGNFAVVCISEDQGKTFDSTQIVIEHPNPDVRIYDPNIWLDPDNRLWLFWAQAYGFNDGRSGVWTSICNHPDKNHFKWSSPRRIANGIMMNKPTVLSTGEWLFPCAIWCNTCGSTPSENHGLKHEQFSNVYVSTDKGESINLRGHADVPNRSFDEHMIVEKKDGSLWMLVRTFDGIGESYSYDKGYTWTEGKKSAIPGPCSRFHIRRLKSGRLLLINHFGFKEKITLDSILAQGNVKNWKGRSHLTAMLSDDDGETWPWKLLLDERNEVSYPDATEGSDGYIYITYDWERVQQREILFARIKEEDIVNGNINSPDSVLKSRVNKATG